MGRDYVLLFYFIFLFTLCSCQSSSIREPADSGSKATAVSNADTALALYHQTFDGICIKGFSDNVSEAQIKVISDSMAQRDHRIWHYFWHSTRNSWHELTPEQRQFFLSFDPRWQPVRLLGQPSGIHVANNNIDLYDPKKNNAGEDFLFMHHMMMKELFKHFAEEGLPCISPWTALPVKDDKMWPVSGKPEAPKDDDSFLKMEAWRKNFQSPAYLSKKSFGEIGYLLEVSLHNNMHMRWTTDKPPAGFGERPDITPETLKLGLEKYDDPHYNWLTDPYGAHVNKVFWKLHGLVESVVFSWLGANGYSSIEVDCQERPGCYEWKGTWVGASPHGTPVKSAPHHGAAKSGHLKAPNFEDAFSNAFDSFVNGRSAGGAISKGPGRSLTVSPQEKARRKKVILDALKTLNKNSPMSRGALSKELIHQTSSPIYDDPEAYVHLIEKKESEK